MAGLDASAECIDKEALLHVKAGVLEVATDDLVGLCFSKKRGWPSTVPESQTHITTHFACGDLLFSSRRCFDHSSNSSILRRASRCGLDKIMWRP